MPDRVVLAARLLAVVALLYMVLALWLSAVYRHLLEPQVYLSAAVAMGCLVVQRTTKPRRSTTWATTRSTRAASRVTW